MTLTLLALASGCITGEIDTTLDSATPVSDTDADADTDTDTDSDSDSDADADSDADSDTDADTDTDTDVETVDVPIDFSGGDPAGLAISVFGLAIDANGFVLGDPIASGTVGDETVVAVPVPDEADLYELTPDAPGLLALIHGIVAFEDTNGDGLHDEGDETIPGVPGERTLIYLGGAVQDYFGKPPGFYVIYETLVGETIVADVDYGIDLEVYDPSSSLVIGGTSAHLPAHGSPQVAVVPLTALQGLPIAPLDDLQPTEAWTFTLSGEPPADHVFDVSDELGRELTIGYELPLAYADSDHSGGYSLDDTPLGIGCDGANAVVAVYAYPPRYLDYAYYFAAGGLNLGWSVLATVPDSDETVVVTDPTGIVIDPTACSLD